MVGKCNLCKVRLVFNPKIDDDDENVKHHLWKKELEKKIIKDKVKTVKTIYKLKYIAKFHT